MDELDCRVDLAATRNGPIDILRRLWIFAKQLLSLNVHMSGKPEAE
jgi:hypothetical protein